MSSRPGWSDADRLHHLAGPRVDREDDRHLAARAAASCGDRLRQQRPVDQGGAVQGDERVARRARPRARAAARRRGTRSSSATRVSIIVLPTKCMRSLGDALGAQVLDRLVAVEEELARRSASATIRLTSSGIVRSKLRRPDSTWATGMPSFAAVSAAARVELTSPGTITRSGRSSSRTGSSRSIVARRLLRVAAGADLEHVVGRRHAELLEEDLRHQPVVVLAGVDDRVATVRQARRAAPRSPAPS